MPEPLTHLYLSSTLKDLEVYRAKVRAALSRRFVIGDSYTADAGTLVESCLSDVRRAKVYVGLFAFRYGYVPSDPQNPDGLSITELEYRAARKANIPCLIFLMSEDHPWPASQMDKPRDKIDSLRTELAQDQRATLFGSEDQLVQLAERAVFEHFERERVEGARATAPSMDPEAQAPHPRQLSHAGLLLYVEGTDDGAAQLLCSTLTGKHALRPLAFAPEEPPSLSTVDAAFSSCRAACLLVSRASLSRLKPVAAALDRWFELFRTQTDRPCVLVTDGVATADLPAPWAPLPTFELGPWLAAGKATLTEPLTTFLREMKTHYVDFDRQGLIALPFSVLAMNEKEAAGLAQAARNAAPTPEVRYLKTLTSWFDQQNIDWTKRYGATRGDFRPFDDKTTVAGLLRAMVREINDQEIVPKRDRENLRGNAIRLRHYPFESKLLDDEDIRKLYVQMKRRGCLVVADELSLCEPRLRAAADMFFDDRSVSVVTLAARDPLLSPFEQTVTEVMNVGDLVGRFRDRLDLRCELAVVSRSGLRRWLRFSVPETLGANDLDVADPDRRASFRREAFR